MVYYAEDGSRKIQSGRSMDFLRKYCDSEGLE